MSLLEQTKSDFQPVNPDIEAEDGHDTEFNYLEAVLTIICVITLSIAWLGGRLGWFSNTIQVGLYVVAYLSGGYFGAIEGFKALRQRELNIDFLMILAALGAASIGEWVEGAILLFLFSLSNTLQSYALNRSRRAIHALMDMRPPEALVKRPDGLEEIVAVEQLQLDDVVIVKPGERLPIDGLVLAGHTTIDQSAITGESIPVERVAGDDVFAGTVNGNGSLEIKVTRLAADTTLAKIIQMVEQAQAQKAPTQRFLDEFEPKYATGVIIATVVMIVIPYFLLQQPFDDVFYRAMTLLVVASPCALVISTPASVLSAIANAARNGILFKGGAYLEQAATIKAIAFDKTGTLTQGRPAVTNVIPATEVLGSAWFDADFFAKLQPKGIDTPAACTSAELLTIAASAELYSEHPLAEAIIKAAQAKNLPLQPVENLQAMPGQGIMALLNEEKVQIGNRRLIETIDQIWPAPLLAEAHQLEKVGKTVVFVSKNNRPLGLIAMADVIRPDAMQALNQLRQLDLKRMVMVTGDTRSVAETVGKELQITEIYADLMPAQKVEVIQDLAQQTHVSMVGDGVNDAPAMAASNLGVAMGAAGTDVALETADVVLMADDLTKLPYVLNLAQRAKRIVWQNIIFSLAVIIVLILSVLVIELPLTIGVIGHEGSTLLVVANGLRLLRTSP